jgi:hypothetical protein
MQTLGNAFLDFAYLLANGTRGGVLLAWKPDAITGLDHDTTLLGHLSFHSWFQLLVDHYCIRSHSDKEQIEFLDELRHG